jgi:hypothetical protein
VSGAVFEDPGELQMTGVLHRRQGVGSAAPSGSADARNTERAGWGDIWEG